MTNNGIGVSSVAGSSKIMPLLVTNSDGYGSYLAMAEALVWAADRGARVANMSFYGPSYSASVRSAAQYMKNRGGLVTVSSGNDGTDSSTIFAPTETMIIVGATNSNDVRTSWSTYGDYLNLVAPGASIWTTSRGGGYNSVSGTSFSAPITAATIALVMSINPSLTPTDIEQILYSTAVDLGTAGWDKYHGHGRVDAAAAVLAAMSGVEKDQIAPSVTILNPSDNSDVSGIISVDVAATDNVGIESVSLLLNGTLISSTTKAPYSFKLDTTLLDNKLHHLTATAKDAAGNSASFSISISVNNVKEEPRIFEIHSITPSTAKSGQTVDMTISGLGLEPGTLIEFTNGGSGPSPEIVSSIFSTDGTNIVVKVHFKAGGPKRNRQWDIVIRRSDGQTRTLVKAVTVHN